MSRTFLRITNEELIIGLAYLAAAFSYLAYLNSQEANQHARKARWQADVNGADIAAHREVTENIDEADDESVDDLEDEVQGDGE